MTQTSRKNNRSHDNMTPAVTSPDGIRIRINRGGNKMQFIRDLCRNEKITHVQFRILVPLVDTSNEGTHENPELWGKSWMNVETLAKESGCSERAVQDNLPLLEAAGIVKVKRDPKGGRSKVNEYWLPGWNRFGAVCDDKEKGAPCAPFNGMERVQPAPERVHVAPKRVHAAPEMGAPCAPDSTHLPNPQHNSYTQPAASLRSGPAGVEFGEGRAQPQPVNDNADCGREARSAGNDNRLGDWPDDWRDQFWNAFPVRKNREKAEAKLISLATSGIKLKPILTAARRHARELGAETQYCKDPVAWMNDEPWLDNEKIAERRLKSRKRTAI